MLRRPPVPLKGLNETEIGDKASDSSLYGGRCARRCRHRRDGSREPGELRLFEDAFRVEVYRATRIRERVYRAVCSAGRLQRRDEVGLVPAGVLILRDRHLDDGVDGDDAADRAQTCRLFVAGADGQAVEEIAEVARLRVADARSARVAVEVRFFTIERSRGRTFNGRRVGQLDEPQRGGLVVGGG